MAVDRFHSVSMNLQSMITTFRPIVARDSMAPTISGSAENDEVEPAIGRIVPAAIIVKRSS